MTEENSSQSTPPPSSTLSRFPHPSSIPRLPPTPIHTNTQSVLPYTPTTPLPSSRFQTPLRAPDVHPAVVHFETQFQSIPEESNVHSNTSTLTSVQQQVSPEHKQTNQQPENNPNAETTSNENYDNQFDDNYVQSCDNDNQTYDHNTNNYQSTNSQSNAMNMQQRQIQQQLFEQQQMFDKTMIYMQQRIQQLEQQVLFSQQEAAQLKFDQAFYARQQPAATWNSNTQRTQINNQSMNNVDLSKIISKPDTFGGNATMIDSWIHSMRNFLLLSGVPAERQVPTVSSFLRGDALNWFVYLSSEDKSKCLTLDDFFTQMVLFFRPVNLVQATRKQLHELQQRGFDLIKFNSRFNQLVQKLPPIDKQQLLDLYREKLDYNIQLALVGKEFSDLSKLQTAAVQADTALKQMKSDRNGSNVNHRFNNTSYNNNSRSRVPHGTTPVVNQNINTQQEESDGEEETQVQVQYASSTMKKSKTSIPKMNEQIRKWCVENKACFRCRQVGHTSSSCTTFPRSTTGGTMLQPSATPSKQNF
jgi:hypothetical protein